MTQTEIVQVLTGFIGTLGFAFLFNIRGRRMAAAAIGGLISWALLCVLNNFVESEAVNYFVVALVMSFYAEIMARIMKTPTTTFVTTTLIPLIPGGSLYYTMAYAFSGNLESFVQKAIDTLQLASALALGIIVSAMVTKAVCAIPAGRASGTWRGKQRS